MLMAEQGARAIGIEPRDGDPGRGTPHFHVLNRSKHAVFLELDSSSGRAQAHELIRLADVVVGGFYRCASAPPGSTRIGAAHQSAAILLQMPPLGSRGPYADLPVADDSWGLGRDIRHASLAQRRRQSRSWLTSSATRRDCWAPPRPLRASSPATMCDGAANQEWNWPRRFNANRRFAS